MQAETVSTTKKKNKYLNNQINLLNKSYDKQVEITLLDGNITEAQKLRLNQEKEILEIMKQQLENIQNQHQSVVDINNARMSNLNNSSQKKLYNENAKEYEKAAKEERNKINSSE